MTSAHRRSLIRAYLDAASAALVVGVCLGVGASSYSTGVHWITRSALMTVPLLMAGLASVSILPFLWRAARGADLRQLLDERGLKLVLAAPIVLLSWWLLGELALRLLAAFSERPASGGLLLATMGAGIVTSSTWLIERLGELLKKHTVSGPLGLALFSSLLAVGVALSVFVGTTSGTGTPLALFGVFKRPELDLSGVGWLLMSMLASLALASLLAARRSRFWLNVLGVLALVGAGFLTFRASRMGFRSAVSVERYGGLASQSLAFFQKRTDRDHDGFSAWFGGGDCNDSDASVNPAAVETWGNPIDENCDGVTELEEAEAPEVETAPPEPQVQAVPDNLNLLLLTVDTLRAELGYARLPGTREKISPHLDELAARSTVYERAYSLASYTSKSLGPMLIGRYPSETPRSFEHFDRFPQEARFIQERLLDASIQTISVQGYWYFFFENYGFERGWETLEHSAAPRVVAIEGDKTKNGDALADDTIMYLKQLGDRPQRFFMWTHWVDPHAEYVPHEEHNYGKSERERYDGEVSFVDAQIGRVLSALKETGLDKNTVIVVTSDHGEAFSEHGMIRHGFEVWEELVHVPLLVHVPGFKPRRVSARRSLIDVAPTISEVFALDLEPGTLRGTSLLRDCALPEEVDAEVRPVLVDMPKGPHNQERRAFYHEQYKLIVSSGRVLGLYDLEADPGETRDLSEDEGLLAQVRAKYDAFVATLKPVFAK